MYFYHVVNRGVDKRKIFSNNRDYYRFVHDMYEFNDVAPAQNTQYLAMQLKEVGLRIVERKPRELLVNLPAFCLMPNHYHLLLQIDNLEAMTAFMRKLNTGYTNYFNLKYDREGALFQGKFKRILIESEQQFAHIVIYIHLNPLDLFMSEWRKRALTDIEVHKCLKFLQDYRWASHLDYLGLHNFPSVTQRDYFLEYFGGAEGYQDALIGWLKAPKAGRIKDFVLENYRKSDFV